MGGGAHAGLGDPLLGKSAKTRPAGRADFADFYRDFEWMGVQRHLKVSGDICAPVPPRRQKRYLRDLPLGVEYLRKACERYRELHPC